IFVNDAVSVQICPFEISGAGIWLDNPAISMGIGVYLGLILEDTHGLKSIKRIESMSHAGPRNLIAGCLKPLPIYKADSFPNIRYLVFSIGNISVQRELNVPYFIVIPQFQFYPCVFHIRYISGRIANSAHIKWNTGIL